MAKRKWFQKSENQPPIITAVGGIIAAFVTSAVGLTVATMGGCFSKNAPPILGNSNHISNSALIVGSSNIVNVDNSQKTYYGETNHAQFKIYINDPEHEFTNGSLVKLSESREIQVYIKNVSRYTVSDTTIEFIPDIERITIDDLNVSGWTLHGDEVSTFKFMNTNMPDVQSHAPVFIVNCGLTPPNMLLALPPIFIKKAFVPINYNFDFPTLNAIFNVFATGSPLQYWDGNFYVPGQNYPSEKELQQGYIDVTN